ncbi:MAG: aspartate kinase [Clostridiales bacterium]|nr:aspartate kinase [Clostridiales bacterium]
MRIVSKFGGSSLADANQIKKVCNIITSNSDRKLIVVSAPGKRFNDDVKVTDLLISLGNAHLQGGDVSYEFKSVINRFRLIAKDLSMELEIVEEISKDIFSKYTSDIKNPGKYMDALKASGEDNCAKLVAKYLISTGVNAEYINPGYAGLILSEEFGNAHVLPESYDNLARLNNNDAIKIFPGFFGYSIHGDIVTLPRGGSDVTGSILAAAVSADIYENFTDVDSVFAVNPNLVKNPTPINDLTYKEMRELSYAGFSVFHEEALTPVYYKGIPVHIKNTNNPEGKGTKIHKYVNKENRNPVTGIAGDKGFSSIYIRKYLMNREIGFTRKVLQILEEENIPYEHIPSGIDEISIVVRKKFLNIDSERKILKRIKKLGTDEVYVTHNQALVMIVGESCLENVNTLAIASKAFADHNIHIKMINQGSSKVSIMFGMDERFYEEAIIALYKAFY